MLLEQVMGRLAVLGEMSALMLFSVMRFIHEPLTRIYRVTLSHALTLINELID